MFFLRDIKNNSKLSERGRLLYLQDVGFLLIAVLAVITVNAFLLEIFRKEFSEKFGECLPIISTIAFSVFIYASIFLLIQIFLSHSKISWSRLLGTKYGTLRTLFSTGILYGVVLFFIIGSAKFFLEYVSSILQWDAPQQEVVDLLSKPENLKWYYFFLMAAVTVVLAPIVEEILFRGILYVSLREIFNPLSAALTVSLLFGISHGNLLVLLPLTMFSLILIYQYEKEGNLLACILAHAIFNFLNFILIQFNA